MTLDDLDDEQRDFLSVLKKLATVHAMTDRAQRSEANPDAVDERADFAERARQGLLDGCAAGELMGIPADVINQAIASARGLDPA